MNNLYDLNVAVDARVDATVGKTGVGYDTKRLEYVLHFKLRRLLPALLRAADAAPGSAISVSFKITSRVPSLEETLIVFDRADY